MKELLLDVLDDLRTKRMLPVAIILGLALLATPVVLARSGPEGEATPPVASAPPGLPTQGVPALTKADEPGAGSSDLDLFSARDPFSVESPRPRRSPGGDGGSAGGGDPGALDPDAVASPGGAAGGSPLGSGKDSSDSAAAAGAGGASGAPASGGTGGDPVASPTPQPPSEDTPRPPSDDTPKPPPSSQPSRFYSYAAVVEYGRPGEERRQTLRELDGLPSDKRPLAVFLGVSREGEAVFLLDSEITQRGEGQCRPSPEMCSLLRLRDTSGRDTHSLVDSDEKTYRLRLVDIRRELDDGRRDDEGTPAGGARAAGASARTPNRTAEARARRRASRTALARLTYTLAPLFGERRDR